MTKDAPFLLDCHVDTIQRVVDAGADLAAGIPDGQVDLDRLEAAGVGVVFFSLFVETKYLPDRCFARAVALGEAVHAQAAAHPGRLEVARSADEARRIVSEGRVAAMLGVEGGHAIEEDLGKLRALADLGVRYMTLTWNNHLSWAESCQERGEGTPKGLTDFGRRVCEEMARLGVVTDLSHVSPRTFADVCALDLPPPIATHCAARALCDHRRNLTDAQIETLAARGGVVGITLVPAFLAEDARADAGDAVRHACHILAVGGASVLGLGSDFDGMDETPGGLEDCSKLRALLGDIARSERLDSRCIENVANANVLRVLAASE